jgi:hypothetical protein
VRKTNLKIILPSPSSWPDLTITKQRRDPRKLFYGGDIISALIPPFGNNSLHVAMSMKMLSRCCRPHLQRSRHGEDNSTLPLHRRRRGGGDKTPVLSNLAWRDNNPNDSIYREKLIKNNESPLPLALGEMAEEKGGGQVVVDGGGSSRAGVALPLSGRRLCITL